MSATRQKIGKRRNTSAVQIRGVARREALVKAAIEMLKTQSPQDISFREVAETAGVPEGSAYHFYANKYDLFAAVASEMSLLFHSAQMVPIEPSKVKTWHDVVDILVERGAGIYRNNIIACELLIGSKTPPEVKQVDHKNDMNIAPVMAERFRDHFTLPDIPDFETKLYYFIELTDTLFAISYRENGKISDSIIEEAKRVGRGYLSTYLPQVLSNADKAS